METPIEVLRIEQNGVSKELMRFRACDPDTRSLYCREWAQFIYKKHFVWNAKTQEEVPESQTTPNSLSAGKYQINFLLDDATAEYSMLKKERAALMTQKFEKLQEQQQQNDTSLIDQIIKACELWMTLPSGYSGLPNLFEPVEFNPYPDSIPLVEDPKDPSHLLDPLIIERQALCLPSDCFHLLKNLTGDILLSHTTPTCNHTRPESKTPSDLEVDRAIFNEKAEVAVKKALSELTLTLEQAWHPLNEFLSRLGEFEKRRTALMGKGCQATVDAYFTSQKFVSFTDSWPKEQLQFKNKKSTPEEVAKVDQLFENHLEHLKQLVRDFIGQFAPAHLKEIHNLTTDLWKLIVPTIYEMGERMASHEDHKGTKNSNAAKIGESLKALDINSLKKMDSTKEVDIAQSRIIETLQAKVDDYFKEIDTLLKTYKEGGRSSLSSRIDRLNHKDMKKKIKKVESGYYSIRQTFRYEVTENIFPESLFCKFSLVCLEPLMQEGEVMEAVTIEKEVKRFVESHKDLLHLRCSLLNDFEDGVQTGRRELAGVLGKLFLKEGMRIQGDNLALKRQNNLLKSMNVPVEEPVSKKKKNKKKANTSASDTSTPLDQEIIPTVSKQINTPKEKANTNANPATATKSSTKASPLSNKTASAEKSATKETKSSPVVPVEKKTPTEKKESIQTKASAPTPIQKKQQTPTLDEKKAPAPAAAEKKPSPPTTTTVEKQKAAPIPAQKKLDAPTVTEKKQTPPALEKKSISKSTVEDQKKAATKIQETKTSVENKALPPGLNRKTPAPPANEKKSPAPPPGIENKTTAVAPPPGMEKKVTTTIPPPGMEKKATTTAPPPGIEKKATTVAPPPGMGKATAVTPPPAMGKATAASLSLETEENGVTDWAALQATVLAEASTASNAEPVKESTIKIESAPVQDWDTLRAEVQQPPITKSVEASVWSTSNTATDNWSTEKLPAAKETLSVEKKEDTSLGGWGAPLNAEPVKPTTISNGWNATVSDGWGKSASTIGWDSSEKTSNKDAEKRASKTTSDTWNEPLVEATSDGWNEKPSTDNPWNKPTTNTTDNSWNSSAPSNSWNEPVTNKASDDSWNKTATNQPSDDWTGSTANTSDSSWNKQRADSSNDWRSKPNASGNDWNKRPAATNSPTNDWNTDTVKGWNSSNNRNSGWNTERKKTSRSQLTNSWESKKNDAWSTTKKIMPNSPSSQQDQSQEGAEIPWGNEPITDTSMTAPSPAPTASVPLKPSAPPPGLTASSTHVEEFPPTLSTFKPLSTGNLQEPLPSNVNQMNADMLLLIVKHLHHENGTLIHSVYSMQQEMAMMTKRYSEIMALAREREAQTLALYESRKQTEMEEARRYVLQLEARLKQLESGGHLAATAGFGNQDLFAGYREEMSSGNNHGSHHKKKMWSKNTVVRCGNCAKYGHESADCKAFCRYCGSDVHLSEACPMN